MKKTQRYRIVIKTYDSGIVTFKPEKRKGFVWKGIHSDGLISQFKDGGSVCTYREDALNIIDKSRDISVVTKIDFEYINK